MCVYNTIRVRQSALWQISIAMEINLNDEEIKMEHAKHFVFKHVRPSNADDIIIKIECIFSWSPEMTLGYYCLAGIGLAFNLSQNGLFPFGTTSII